MQILRIQPNLTPNVSLNLHKNKNVNKNYSTPVVLNSEMKLPMGNIYGANIAFTAAQREHRQTVPDIDFDYYKNMSTVSKKRIMKKYMNFCTDKAVNPEELVDQKYKYLPLRSEQNMEDFIKVSQIYLKYKDNPIICLGRSPKWFLNAALWMENGIDKYTFVAFSKFWHRPDPIEGYRRMPFCAPKPEEEKAYRNYLRKIEASPLHIVKHFEETGKKTVITDYICSGKGACSFLDVMSRFADDLGLTERFSKAIKIVGIGCLEYMADLQKTDGSVSDPEVFMPEKLHPYRKNVEQEFHDMPFGVFEEMLLNQNTNECRSTFYPHDAWTIYRPDKFKTGLIKDLKKVENVKTKLGADFGKKTVSSFAPAMRDFRNLLNFRILSALDERGLLKAVCKTRI